MKLLLAEDEKELSNALTKILTHNNYVVDAVYNGDDALEYLQVEQYDGVILDVMMPKMDGFTVLRNLREQGNKVPILILTAKAEIDDRVTGLDYGADDYLTKPFAMKELLARIRSITRRNTDASSSILSQGNVKLDCASFRLCCGDASLRLPSKEFQMMEMFMSYPNKVFSAENFMEKIWDYDTDAEVNVVWVNISNLRGKLASLNANVKIYSVRNQGYHIEVDK